MDKNGKPHSTLRSKKLLHYPVRDTSILQEPSFIFYADNALPWHVNAKQGRSIHGHQQIDLKNDVFIQQLDENKHPQMTLQTSAITIYPDRSYATSTQAVELTEPDVALSGIGMNAYLQEKRIKLLHHVRGTHAMY
jgi:lipopolysaccharide export system protein LptC